MDRDDAGNLFVAANGGGAIWKADPAGQLCVLLPGLPPFPDGPSAVAVGVRGSPFPAENLYVVAFNGDLTEVASVAEVASASLLLTVTPRKVRAGKRRRLRFRVTSSVDGFPVPGARVALGRVSATTDLAGYATLRRKLRRPGKHRARASKSGLEKRPRSDSRALNSATSRALKVPSSYDWLPLLHAPDRCCHRSRPSGNGHGPPRTAVLLAGSGA